MATIQRTVRKADGTVEIFIPHVNKRGRFVIAPREAVYRNTGDVQIEVETEAELIEKARSGEYCIRMSSGDGAPSLIAPESYTINE